MQDLSRLKLLTNDEKLERIKNSNVLLIGLGGVGGYVFETLIRSGILNITVVDGDVFEESNLNRQLLSTSLTINKNKTDAALERALIINDKVNVKKITKVITTSNISEIDFGLYDYVIDACDTLKIKEEIIRICTRDNIKFITCMGTGNKMHPELLEITDLSKTQYDPIARRLRKMVRDEHINKKIPVIASKEKPIKVSGSVVGSNSFVPACAGILLTSYVINDIVGEV